MPDLTIYEPTNAEKFRVHHPPNELIHFTDSTPHLDDLVIIDQEGLWNVIHVECYTNGADHIYVVMIEPDYLDVAPRGDWDSTLLSRLSKDFCYSITLDPIGRVWSASWLIDGTESAGDTVYSYQELGIGDAFGRVDTGWIIESVQDFQPDEKSPIYNTIRCCRTAYALVPV